MSRWISPTFALLAVAFAGCTPTSTSSAGAQDKAVVVPKLGHPKKMDLTRIIEQPASIEPLEETPLVAHISGYVEKDPADIGKKVRGPEYDAKGEMSKPGEVLATLSI